MAGRAPLPPDFKVLFYGNSYVRQVMAWYILVWSGAGGGGAPCVQYYSQREGCVKECPGQMMLFVFSGYRWSKRLLLATLHRSPRFEIWARFAVTAS